MSSLTPTFTPPPATANGAQPPALAAVLAAEHFSSQDFSPQSSQAVSSAPVGGTPMGRRSRSARLMMGSLLFVVAAAVAVVLLSPVALSSHDLIGWASSPAGLGQSGRWPVLVILSLDAPALVFVGMSILSTWRGEHPGIFAYLIWVFAGASAFANWRHSLAAAPDAQWFFPCASLAGPGILEPVLHRVRAWIRQDQAPAEPAVRRRARWARWVPWLGSFADTFGATRTQLLLGCDSFEEALTEYHRLCPDGSVRVARALRLRHQAQAQAELLTTLDAWPEPADDDPAPGSISLRAFWRLPVDPDAYQGARTAWSHLQDAEQSGRLDRRALQAFAAQHHLSVRQLHYLRVWGTTGLLRYGVSPRTLAELARPGAVPPAPAPHLNYPPTAHGHRRGPQGRDGAPGQTPPVRRTPPP